IRGSSGYGKMFLSLDNGLLREDAYQDIGALLDWIKTRPELDADRIMVSGVSYGAGVTLAVATRYNDLIRCSWAGAPTLNLFPFFVPGRIDAPSTAMSAILRCGRSSSESHPLIAATKSQNRCLFWSEKMI